MDAQRKARGKGPPAKGVIGYQSHSWTMLQHQCSRIGWGIKSSFIFHFSERRQDVASVTIKRGLLDYQERNMLGLL